MKRPSNWHAQQTTPKKHRAQHSIARSLKNFMEAPNHPQSHEPSTSSYQNLLTPSASTSNPSLHASNSRRGSPHRANSDESSWDVIEELPLRWATDFVALASPGSRLMHASVISYALWQDEGRRGRGGQMLAIATKCNILLYETPRTERSFRFVKVRIQFVSTNIVLIGLRSSTPLCNLEALRSTNSRCKRSLELCRSNTILEAKARAPYASPGDGQHHSAHLQQICLTVPSLAFSSSLTRKRAPSG